jgi:CheY-like chemotaxis protein
MARILVVEDDQETRAAVAGMLQDHTVFQAANGKEALRLLNAQAIDLLITDLVMPAMDGIETIVAVRREFPQLKIIAVSGAAAQVRDASLSTAKQLGANDTLHKPFTREELINTVHSALGHPTP